MLEGRYRALLREAYVELRAEFPTMELDIVGPGHLPVVLDIARIMQKSHGVAPHRARSKNGLLLLDYNVELPEQAAKFARSLASIGDGVCLVCARRDAWYYAEHEPGETWAPLCPDHRRVAEQTGITVPNDVWEEITDDGFAPR